MRTQTNRSNVVVLQSHPIWVAAQRQARELDEAIRRHPSSRRSPA